MDRTGPHSTEAAFPHRLSLKCHFPAAIPPDVENSEWFRAGIIRTHSRGRQTGMNRSCVVCHKIQPACSDLWPQTGAERLLTELCHPPKQPFAAFPQGFQYNLQNATSHPLVFMLW